MSLGKVSDFVVKSITDGKSSLIAYFVEGSISFQRVKKHVLKLWENMRLYI